ncbi:MAG: Hpt domain-containing protein [Dongiaceae bacterium]
MHEDLLAAHGPDAACPADDPAAADPAIAAIIAELGRLFVARLPDDLARLERCAAVLAAGDAGALPELRSIAHDLAGCGGSFGYPAISTRAAAVDQEAMRLIAGAPGQGDLAALLAELIATCRAALPA